ncbi:hypothetical protein AWB67_07683 [Caballeronia terrestris]|uniref:Uncharacterized protein n=1 Tax=Caballeronia terrestris TaxID=1226301 RepID=A0A158L6E6_9BURK|nr:hypothetical protein AWB67_07683 [Caballeronia terrestris]
MSRSQKSGKASSASATMPPTITGLRPITSDSRPNAGKSTMQTAHEMSAMASIALRVKPSVCVP